MIEKTKYKHLFTPLKIGEKLVIKNRIAYAPVGSGLSTNNSGAFDRIDEEFYVTRAKGGAGLIFTGSTRMDMYVDKVALGAYGTWHINYNPALYKMTAFRMLERVHSYGAKMFAQITMGNGRNHSEKAPSEIPTYDDPSKNSPALTVEEIQLLIEQYANAALVAKNAGFDGVEVHAMHFGYLMDEFALEICNQRTDKYGGSLENRMRVAKELVEAVKEKCGKDFPVSMRLGLKSYIKGFKQASIDGSDEAGRTLEEGIKIGRLLESFGYDLLNVDAGLYDSFYYCYPPMYMPLGLNACLAAELKKAVNIPVLVCGRMHDVDLCEETVASGKADGVVMGRQMLADPDFAIKAKLNKAEDIRPCLSCNFGCRGRLARGLDLTCAINPQARREAYYDIVPALVKKDIMVVGAGIAGMEAARVAAMRGHKVTVYEKSDRVGGIFNIAGIPEFKEEDRKLVKWYEHQLNKLGVKIVFNKEVDLDFILSVSPDAVISAKGSSPVVPRVDGLDHSKAVGFVPAMKGEVPVGQNVVVVGGGLVGCEVALNFMRKGHKVTIVEFLSDILSAGAPTPFMNKMYLQDDFKYSGVEIKANSALTAVNDEGAVIKTAEGLETVPADTVILAVGLRSNPSFAPELNDYGIEAYSIGDEREVANLMNAVGNGYEVGRTI